MLSSHRRLLAIGLLLALTGVAQPAPLGTETNGNNGSVRTDLYGDPLPARALARLGSVQWRTGGFIYRLAFSADGKTFVTASHDGKVRSWDLDTGKVIREIVAHGADMALSPDGRLVAVSNGVFEVATGKKVLELPADALTHNLGLAFFADNQRLLVAGKRVAAVETGFAHIWDVAKGKKLVELDKDLPPVSCLALSPAGNLLALGAGAGPQRTLVVLDARELKETRRLPVQKAGGHLAVAFSTDGRHLAASSSDTISVWEAASGKKVRDIVADQTTLIHVRFLDQQRLVAGGFGGARLGCWDVTTGKPALELTLDGLTRAEAVACCPPRDLLAVGGQGGRVRFFDTKTGKMLPQRDGHDGDIHQFTIAADGASVLSGGIDGLVRVWQTDSGKCVHTLRAKGVDIVRGVAFCPDGKSIAAAGAQDVTFWNRGDGKETAVRKVPNNISMLLVPPGSKELFLGYFGRGLTAWDLEQARDLWAADCYHHTGVQFSPDGRHMLAFDNRNTAFCWNLKTGVKEGLIHVPEQEGQKYYRYASIAPAGQLLIVTLYDRARMIENRIPVAYVLCERASAQERFHLGDYSGTVPLVAPDGSLLAGSTGQEIIVWDATGKELARLKGHVPNALNLRFTPNSRRLISASSDGTLLVWDLADLHEAAAPKGPAWTEATLAAAWETLADKDARIAYRGLRSLLASPRDTVPFLKGRLAGVKGIQPTRVKDLIAALDHDEFERRKEAFAALAVHAHLIEPELQQAVKADHSLEVKKQLERLLERKDAPIRMTEYLRICRALEALELIHTDESRQALTELAKLPEAPAWLKTEAELALARFAAR